MSSILVSVLLALPAAQASDPRDCGATHDAIVIHVLSNAAGPLSEAEYTALVDDYVVSNGLGPYDPGIYQQAAFSGDPAAGLADPALDPVLAGQLQQYLDVVSLRQGTPVLLADEGPLMIAELEAIDQQTAQLLTGELLDYALCASAVAQASIALATDAEPVVLADDGGDGGGDDEDDDCVDVVQADVNGAVNGGIGGAILGGAGGLAGAPGGPVVGGVAGGMMGGALGAGVASANAYLGVTGFINDLVESLTEGPEGGPADPTDNGNGNGNGNGDGDGDGGLEPDPDPDPAP